MSFVNSATIKDIEDVLYIRGLLRKNRVRCPGQESMMNGTLNYDTLLLETRFMKGGKL